jgi:hypothetical protein
MAASHTILIAALNLVRGVGTGSRQSYVSPCCWLIRSAIAGESGREVFSDLICQCNQIPFGIKILRVLMLEEAAHAHGELVPCFVCRDQPYWNTARIYGGTQQREAIVILRVHENARGLEADGHGHVPVFSCFVVEFCDESLSRHHWIDPPAPFAVQLSMRSGRVRGTAFCLVIWLLLFFLLLYPVAIAMAPPGPHPAAIGRRVVAPRLNQGAYRPAGPRSVRAPVQGVKAAFAGVLRPQPLGARSAMPADLK